MSQSTNPTLTKSSKRPLATTLWRETRRFILMFIGVLLVAFGYVMFQVPYNIAAGGITGIALIINSITGWPVGVLFWVMNVPMLILGFFQLGRWPFLWRTLIAATLFSITADLFTIYLPDLVTPYPLSDDLLLNTIYGGIIGGIGGGFIYRSGSTLGSTGVIGRIIQRRTGLPLSQSYLFTDGTIIAVAGLLFGWEIALYAFLMLFINGMASDYTLEGPSSTRTAMIVTNNPEALIAALTTRLNRGLSYWEVVGGYSGSVHYMLYCTIYRPQVGELKQVVAETDPAAFVTIGVSHQAMGQGFAPLRGEE